MLGGYSWRQKRFRVWTLHYDDSIKRFTFKPWARWRGQSGPGKEIAFLGDSNVVQEAKSKLVDMLRSKQKLSVGGLDMEPFEVLCTLLKEAKFAEIGGPPQIVKVYEHMNAHAFPVYWPTHDSKVCAFGRPLLRYEVVKSKLIDPDNL